MNCRAAGSNSMRSARSSVVRDTREISDTVMIPTMNIPEIARPSGLSMTFLTSAYSSTAVSSPNPAPASRCRRRNADTVTAKAPETIMARMPVAYAPAWALTSAPNAMVMMTQIAV